MEIEVDESDFISVSSSQESLLRRKEFVDENSQDSAGIHGGDKVSHPADLTPILMVSPPTSSEHNDVAAPNDDVFQTPPEEAPPHSATSSQSIDRHEMLADQNLGIGFSPEKTQEFVETNVRVSEKEPVMPPTVRNPRESARKKIKIPLREVVRAIIRNSGEAEDDRRIERLSYVDIAKLKGMNIP